MPNSSVEESWTELLFLARTLPPFNGCFKYPGTGSVTPWEGPLRACTSAFREDAGRFSSCLGDECVVSAPCLRHELQTCHLLTCDLIASLPSAMSCLQEARLSTCGSDHFTGFAFVPQTQPLPGLFQQPPSGRLDSKGLRLKPGTPCG